jgi:hypothetical protein
MAFTRKSTGAFLRIERKYYLFLSEVDGLPTERECIVCGEWLEDLAFLVGITCHLNALNVSFKGTKRYS